MLTFNVNISYYMSEVILTDKNFSEEVLKAEKPVLVDFWAGWCMPCRMMEPIIQEIAEKFGKKIKVGKLNIDENPLTANNFMVDVIPTLILFKDGKIIRRLRGVQPKEDIIEAIDSEIKSAN